MLKVMWLMKRREGTSFAELVEAYEVRHSVLAANLFAENHFVPVKYVRRYFHPVTDILPAAAQFSGTDFDLAMEMWFEDRAHFERMIEFSSPEEVWDMITADERTFLDPHRRAIVVLEDHETSFEAQPR